MSVNSKMTAIADAIRLKTGRTDTLTLDEMASALNNIPTQTAKTITPGTSSQTAINGGTFATGKVTVKGDSNLKAENIVSGKSIFGVNGTYVGADTDIEDGIVARTITSYTNSRVKRVGTCAFYGCSKLKTVDFASCSTIGSSAFGYCSSLTTISFPNCKQIFNTAFIGCKSLTTADFPSCLAIDYSAFASCSFLTSINFPLCLELGQNVFAYTNIKTANFPACSAMNSYVFHSCSNLTTVNFPVYSGLIPTGTFYNCTKLTAVNFPKCTAIWSNAFENCGIVNVNFPACTSISRYAFRKCTSLTTASFPACYTIESSAFISCSKLSTIYLAGSSVCKLQHSNAFSSTKITSTTGSIYVPLSLGWSYKNATNWTYFFNRIFSIEGEEIVEPPISFTIDGIAYEAAIGSTWSDWVISDYNTAGFKINGAAIVSADGSVQIAGVIASDLIEENYNYVTNAIGAFGDPITFSVIVDTYTALDGMTWADWVSSEYNSSDDYGNYRAISVDMENNVVKYGDRDEIITNEDWEAVTPYDLIIANM